jgi:NAD(P)-dependent dehydrogenase (short-subunit alcohol dehydrogenase family)
VCARDGAELERAADRLRSAGAEVAAVACDVTRERSAGQLVDAARERYGRLDILVNNAGIIRVGPVQSTRAADYEAALATMTMAPVRLALAALPVMRAQGHSRIVTITSIGGKLSVPHLLPYSTAKFAAVGFSEGLLHAVQNIVLPAPDRDGAGKPGNSALGPVWPSIAG